MCYDVTNYEPSLNWYKYKLKCLYRRKFEAEKSLLRPPSAIFGAP